LKERTAMRRRQALIPSLLAIVAVAVSPARATASVEPITLKELVGFSEMIVLATVTKVEDAPAGLKYGDHGPDERTPKVATARVLEVWKGSPGPEVRYMASRSWVCDTATARVGERVVLFLSRLKGLPFLVIEHSGRGRMPLRIVGTETFAVLPNAVGLPEDAPVVWERKPFDPQAPPPINPKGPPPSPLTHYNEGSIKLEALKRLVESIVEEKRHR
jgi:hypothetical protein